MHDSRRFWDEIAEDIQKKYGKGHPSTWKRSNFESFLSHLEEELMEITKDKKNLANLCDIDHSKTNNHWKAFDPTTLENIFRYKKNGGKRSKNVFAIYLGYNSADDYCVKKGILPQYLKTKISKRSEDNQNEVSKQSQQEASNSKEIELLKNEIQGLKKQIETGFSDTIKSIERLFTKYQKSGEFNEAEQYFQKRNYSEAIKSLNIDELLVTLKIKNQSVIEHQIDKEKIIDAILIKVYLLYRNKKLKKCLKLLKKALKIDPTNTKVIVDLSLLYAETKNNDKAIEFLKNAIGRNPSAIFKARIYLTIATFYCLTYDQLSLGIKYIEKVIDILSKLKENDLNYDFRETIKLYLRLSIFFYNLNCFDHTAFYLSKAHKLKNKKNISYVDNELNYLAGLMVILDVNYNISRYRLNYTLPILENNLILVRKEYEKHPKRNFENYIERLCLRTLIEIKKEKPSRVRYLLNAINDLITERKNEFITNPFIQSIVSELFWEANVLYVRKGLITLPEVEEISNSEYYNKIFNKPSYTKAKIKILEGHTVFYLESFHRAKEIYLETLDILDDIKKKQPLEISYELLTTYSFLIYCLEKTSSDSSTINKYAVKVLKLIQEIQGRDHSFKYSDYQDALNLLCESNYLRNRPKLSHKLFMISFESLGNLEKQDKYWYCKKYYFSAYGVLMSIYKKFNVFNLDRDLFEALAFISDFLSNLYENRNFIDNYIFSALSNIIDFFNTANNLEISTKESLLIACQNNFIDLAEEAYLRGVNDNLRFENYATAMEIAKKNGYHELVEVIRKFK
ncbi:hypothetical protein TPENAI_20062 [Tenacibaculum litopenaei]|uniref:tetratricopeptide repeat protein n=1 Tax=Tenacibaculum litopenaei TaxID=396016 RepID=UPI0038951CCE